MKSLSKYLSELRLGERTEFENLTMFSLEGPAESALEYVTLDEALRAGLAQVSEISDSGRVPELKVSNNGDLPVLIMDGEELVGAKQNRTVNLTILAPARATTVIPVSCVEAGRWQYQSPGFATSNRHHFARGRASRTATVSRCMNSDGRRFADQGLVWSEISAKVARMGTRSQTQAMGDIFDHHHSSVDRYVDAFAARAGQTGAMFAIGPEIVGLDLFDHHATLVAMLVKLVRSYAVDALENDRRERSHVADDAARAFLTRLAEAEVSMFDAIGLGTDLRINGRELVGGGLAFEDQLVHLAAFAVEGRTSRSADGSGRMASPRIRRAARFRE